MAIRILIADDHEIMRKGIVALIEKQPGMQVVGEAANGIEAMRLAKQLAPDVIVMDVSMPELNGIDASARIFKAIHNARIIILSMHKDERFISRAFRSGVSGYLLKECTFAELARAITEVAAGNKYVSPSISSTVVKNYLSVNSVSSSVLTSKERQVLQLISEGHSTKEISRFLEVSVKTVETHRQHMMEKLGLHSVAELTKYSVREGLTSL